MQHIPHHNLDDIERSRAEMQAFRQERDITLTGEDIHSAYCRIEPDESRPWGSLNLVAQRRYEALAKELNRELQAWLEEDRVTISGVRCCSCNEMLDSEHAEGHACWQKGDK